MSEDLFTPPRDEPSLFRQLLCAVGIHSWVVISEKHIAGIRADAWEDARGKVKAKGLIKFAYGNFATDRVCEHCRKRDNQIERLYQYYYNTERKRLKVIEEATANDKKGDT